MHKPKIEVGPVGNFYAYRVDGRPSLHRYANRESALFNAKRPQRLAELGHVEPDPKAELKAQRKSEVQLWRCLTRKRIPA